MYLKKRNFSVIEIHLYLNDRKKKNRKMLNLIHNEFNEFN